MNLTIFILAPPIGLMLMIHITFVNLEALTETSLLVGKECMMKECKDCGNEYNDYLFTNSDDICDYCWAMRGGN